MLSSIVVCMLKVQVWNPLGIVGVITAFNFPCAVLGLFLFCLTVTEKVLFILSIRTDKDHLDLLHLTCLKHI